MCSVAVACLLCVSAASHSAGCHSAACHSRAPAVSQEEGNVDFVRQNGFGDFRSEPEGIAKLVASYLADGPGLARMAQAARTAGKPEATMEIAKDLAKYLL